MTRIEQIERLDQAIARAPGRAWYRETHAIRALARAALGRHQEALVDAERLVTLSPQWGPSYYARGVALSGLGRDRDAIADFEESLRRRPELIYPLRARAVSYDRLGDSGRAAADRDEARRREEREPNYAVCLDPFRY
jgi:tetratricopeptide (TPR) repeat protein